MELACVKCKQRFFLQLEKGETIRFFDCSACDHCGATRPIFLFQRELAKQLDAPYLQLIKEQKYKEKQLQRAIIDLRKADRKEEKRLQHEQRRQQILAQNQAILAQKNYNLSHHIGCARCGSQAFYQKEHSSNGKMIFLVFAIFCFIIGLFTLSFCFLWPLAFAFLIISLCWRSHGKDTICSDCKFIWQR
jgi:hypothetical protein